MSSIPSTWLPATRAQGVPIPCHQDRAPLATNGDSTRGADSTLQGVGGRRSYDKDILKTGSWRVGGRRWHVTRASLHRLAANWRLANLRGVRIPVVWNHSHDARDQIGEITKVYVVGNTLRARFWAADPEDVRKLGVTVNQVSAEVHEPWFDGQGHRYDLMLVHLGVVNLPVIAPQQPFRRLRLLLSGERTMENASQVPDAALDACLDDSSDTRDRVDLDVLLRAINRLLQTHGVQIVLPEDTTWDTLMSRLESLVPDATASLSIKSDVSQADQELTALRDEYARVSDELRREREQAEQQRRQTFLMSLDQLLSDGRISAIDRSELLQAAAPANYALGLLAPFQRIPVGSTVPTQRRARVSASGDPPSVSPTAEMSGARAAEVARTFRQ